MGGEVEGDARSKRSRYTAAKRLVSPAQVEDEDKRLIQFPGALRPHDGSITHSPEPI